MILQATHWKPLSAALGLLAAAALLTQHAHVRAQESDEVVTIQARLTQGGPRSPESVDMSGRGWDGIMGCV